MIEFPTEYFEKIDVEKLLQMMTKKSRKITQHAKSLVTLPTSGAADNFCKQFGPRSGPTQCGAWSGSKLFDTDGIPERSEVSEKVHFEKKNIRQEKKA